MKKVKLLLAFALISMLLVVINVEAVTNPYKKITSWGDVNCTWSTWQETYKRTGIALPEWGNAREWYTDAKNAGYAVGSEPKAKSIIVLDNYENYGHVAYVDHVSDGKVYVWDSVTCYREMTDEEYATWRECIYNETTSADDEYLCDYLIVKEETTCEYSKENHKLDKVIGYIYITESKTTSSSSNKSSSSTSSASNTKKETKSSNNYLHELSIDGVEFDFDKEILEYNLEVSYDVDTVTIKATAEDEKATIAMDETIDLSVGNNTFKVVVTAEDKSIKEYVVNINRLEKDEELEETKDDNLKKDEEGESPKRIIFWRIVGGISIIGLIVIIIILVRKRN